MPLQNIDCILKWLLQVWTVSTCVKDLVWLLPKWKKLQKSSFYSVFHRVSGGELFERIIDEDFELTERECIKYMKQISEGVQYIHKQGIVHLDLKPENIMCVNKTGTSIKLIDFGLARRLGNDFSAYFSMTWGKGQDRW